MRGKPVWKEYLEKHPEARKILLEKRTGNKKFSEYKYFCSRCGRLFVRERRLGNEEKPICPDCQFPKTNNNQRLSFLLK